MAKFLVLVVFGLFAVAQAQRGGARVRPADGDERRVATTPVPILRQINKVNEDGSYTYGYESADGSYKIETKAVNGEVRGKYGYYDDTGALREIEYGASRQGFNPQGTDVRLPESAPAMAYDSFDDSGYYDPEKYEKPFAYDPLTIRQDQPQPARRPAAAGRRPGGRRAKQQQQQQQQQFSSQFEFSQQAPAPIPQQAPAPQPAYQQQQQPQVINHQPAPAYHQQPYYQPQAPTVAPFNPAQLFHGHPAKNIDINTGSYSVSYGHHG